LALWNFSHEVIFCSKFFFTKCVEVVFSFIVLITSFEDAIKQKIVIHLFSLKENGRLFA
jgi:hypothetical protein